MSHKFCDILIAFTESLRAAGIEVERVHITMPREQFDKFVWNVARETAAIIPPQMKEVSIRGLKCVVSDDVMVVNPSSWDQISTKH